MPELAVAWYAVNMQWHDSEQNLHNITYITCSWRVTCSWRPSNSEPSSCCTAIRAASGVWNSTLPLPGSNIILSSYYHHASCTLREGWESWGGWDGSFYVMVPFCYKMRANAFVCLVTSQCPSRWMQMHKPHPPLGQSVGANLAWWWT